MIYITNVNPENKVEHKIQFESINEKHNYTSKELAYCVAEYSEFSAAMYPLDREKARVKLFHKRMEFLVRQGFHKQPGNLWTKQMNTNDEELA